MNRFTHPDAMQFSGNINENWTKWKQELEFYILATELEEKPEWVKSIILLTCIESKGREIDNTFNFENDGDKMTLSIIITKFEEYCTPRKNLTYLRHKSFTYRQKEGQSFDDFVTQFTSSCEFSTLKELLIRDIIVVGILDNRLWERKLRDKELMLEKVISVGHSAEETNKHIKELAQDEGGNLIDMIQQKSKHGQQQNIINVDTGAANINKVHVHLLIDFAINVVRRDILLHVVVV